MPSLHIPAGIWVMLDSFLSPTVRILQLDFPSATPSLLPHNAAHLARQNSCWSWEAAGFCSQSGAGSGLGCLAGCRHQLHKVIGDHWGL